MSVGNKLLHRISLLENGNFRIHCSEGCMSQSEEPLSNSNATNRVSALAYVAACNSSRMLNVWLGVSVIPDLIESVQCMLEVEPIPEV
jgi:hypothetical protein